jgi:hypothetical protein
MTCWSLLRSTNGSLFALMSNRMQARSWTSSRRVYQSIVRSVGWVNANKQGCHVDRNCRDNLHAGLRRRSSLTSVRSPTCGISSANIKFARGSFPSALLLKNGVSHLEHPQNPIAGNAGDCVFQGVATDQAAEGINLLII